MENITDGSLKTVSDTNAVVKGLNKEKVDSGTLEKFFTEKVGKVKCCKVSKTIESDGENYTCKSNGYGFVNFASKELLDQAIANCNGQELEGSKLIIERYNKEAKRETKFNNLYVRGFPESFTDDDLKKHFEGFGELGSVTVMRDQDGKSKLFGFVCYVSPEAASKAVEEVNGKSIDGDHTWYVAKFEKKANRWAALKKSLARANLYVRNFDKNVTEEDLKKFFGGEGVVRNVRIMTTDVNREDGVHKESKQFGFVSFNNPKDAAEIMQRYNNEDLEFNNKQLYVNYYEDKGARKKRLATKKDNIMGLIDPSALGGENGNMMEYFMQIFQQYIKQYQNNPGMAGGQSYGGYGQGGYGGGYNQGYGGRGGRGPRRGYPQSNYGGYGGHQNMYPRRPQQDAHSSYAHAMPPPAATAPPMMGQMPPQAPPAQPPAQPPVNTAASMYTRAITNLVKGNEFSSLDEDTKREKIGEEIYNYVLEKAGDESAPKITGMIIDLPFSDLLSSVQTWDGLQEKIQEGLDLLNEDQ